MKVALIHYWLINMRGGERVLESLCRLYPQADIFTHVVDRSKLSQTLLQHNIFTTFIQKLPWSKKFYSKYLPLMPNALEQLDLSEYDLIISSESGPAKGVITRAGSLHICYCHTPMRYLWDFYHLYMANASPIVRLFMRFFCTRLRMWDVTSSNRVDHFIANSHTVARRINKHWRRKAVVVHPPVTVDDFPLNTNERDNYYLYLGQLVHYKRVDIAIEACNRLGLRLIIAGDGECRKALQDIAGPTVTFIGHQRHDQINSLYANCRALLFPGEEDFGIVPVEAMSTGAPVIALGCGGATETVIDGKTGVLFAEQTADCLCAALEHFEQHCLDFDPRVISQHASTFSEQRFQTEFLEQVQNAQILNNL